MLVVIDTNILLVAISDKSKYYLLYQLIVDNKIQIALTNDIITEYEEQIGLHWNTKVAADLTRLLSELPNVF